MDSFFTKIFPWTNVLRAAAAHGAGAARRSKAFTANVNKWAGVSVAICVHWKTANKPLHT